MNFPFIIFLIVIVAFTIFAWTFDDNVSWLYVCGIIGVFVSSGLLIVSFVVPLGTPVTKILLSEQFRLEETPYRIIIQADGKEWTWTDAYTVTTVAKEKPVAVKVVYLANAWGIVYETMDRPTMKPQATMLFAKDVEKRGK